MKKVVIIGGGFAGSYSAMFLESCFDVTLVDTKNYFEFTPGILRAISEPEEIKDIQIYHKNYLKKSKLIKSSVKEIKDNFVVLNNNSKIDFDYLIIASGSSYKSPIKEENVLLVDRGKHIRVYGNKLDSAKSVLIIGGGIVGVELAGEISTLEKNKKITLIHSHSRLMEGHNSKTSKIAERFLRKKGIELIFNEKVISGENKVFKTD